MFALLSKHQYVASKPPAWTGAPVFVTLADFQSSLRRHAPNCTMGYAKDGAFVVVPMTVLDAAANWTLTSLKNQGITYGPEAFDCENFVNELHQTLCKMAVLAGIKATPLTCCVMANLTHAWAGAGSTGAHALTGVLTNRGVVIMESQNGQRCAIEEYPNRSTIYRADNF